MSEHADWILKAASEIDKEWAGPDSHGLSVAKIGTIISKYAPAGETSAMRLGYNPGEGKPFYSVRNANTLIYSGEDAHKAFGEAFYAQFKRDGGGQPTQSDEQIAELCPRCNKKPQKFWRANHGAGRPMDSMVRCCGREMYFDEWQYQNRRSEALKLAREALEKIDRLEEKCSNAWSAGDGDADLQDLCDIGRIARNALHALDAALNNSQPKEME